MRLASILAAVASLILGCSSAESGPGTGGGTHASSGVGAGGGGAGGGHDTGGGGSGGGAGGGSNDPDGRYGVPKSTFTIPDSSMQDNGTLIYLPDIQASFPAVDWSTPDRLYIPARHYEAILLGNLPLRTADRPLVITNHGGQVIVGGFDHSFTIAIQGGANWVLTGRADSVSKTGDSAFPGHRGNHYDDTREKYGFLVDDQFNDPGQNGRIGVSVGGRATDFEIEYLEVTRFTFAGVVLKTDDDGTATMKNVRFHDNYVHDTYSEGLYFGSTQPQPQHQLVGFDIYNNRIIRTGTETAQFGQMGDGVHVHHNVFAYGALMWHAAFECGGQDNTSQFMQRNGATEVDHNVYVGGATSNWILFPTDIAGDAHAATDVAHFHDNYLSSSRKQTIYVGDRGPVAELAYRIDHNYLRDLVYAYDQVYASDHDPDAFVQFNMVSLSYSLSDNQFDGTQHFDSLSTLPNGHSGSATFTGNAKKKLPELAFADAGLPSGFDVFRLEVWQPVESCYTPPAGDPPQPRPRTYAQGDYVMHFGELFELTAASSTNEPPDTNPGKWKSHGKPKDDVRVSASSPYAGIGLYDTP